jgi:hypothetical protein
MRRILCLATGEYVLDIDPVFLKKRSLEYYIKYHACYRTIYGLHIYTSLTKKKSLEYLNKRELIPNYTLQIVEVPDGE